MKGWRVAGSGGTNGERNGGWEGEREYEEGEVKLCIWM